MPTLVPVDHDPFGDTVAEKSPQALSGKGDLVLESPHEARVGRAAPRLVPVDHDPFAEKPGIAADAVDQAGAGLIRGAALTADLPQTVYDLVDKGFGLVTRPIGAAARRAFGKPDLAPEELARRQAEVRSSIPSPADLPRPGAIALDAFENVAGKLPEPKTTTGAYVRTAAEFVPGAGRRVADVIARGILPGLASEGAGQATKGTAAEPWARIGTGLAAGAVGGLVRSPGAVERAVGQRAEGATAQQVDQAEALFQEAAQRGLPLTRANALDAVTKGGTGLSDLQRVLEGNGRLRGFFAPTAEGVAREGRGALDTIAPAGASPTVLGGEVQDAARAAVAQTPKGMALTQAREGAGPRITPEQAGQTIQPELRRVYEGREGMRAALAEQDYAAARQAPETIGIERTIPVERPGEPIVTQPRLSRPGFEADAPRPLEPYAPPKADDVGPAGKSLGRFIAENGGLRLDGDAAATDLHRFVVPGVGKVARADGKSLDNFWRERLIEEGYFRPDADGGMARDISSELLRKLQNEQRGLPSYPLGTTGRAKGGSTAGMQADEYANAKSLAESRLDADLAQAGVDPKSVHPDVRERAIGAVMRGEHSDPLDAYERTVGAMKGPLAPYSKSTTIAEQIPDVRFGQVNPQSVIDHVDELMRSAKGPVLSALQQARKTLFEQDGRTLDLSVAGLDGSRKAINDLIGKAEPGTQAALLSVRDRLDRALDTVPEYEHARAGFESASRNLDPFAAGTAPGRAVNRDQVTGRQTMAPEKVPEAIAEGPTAARQFGEVASPEARRAMEGRLTTQVLDGATDAAGDVSASGIRDALRRDEDLFAQFPEARANLERVAFAREGREAVDRSPLGQIANRRDAAAAIEALFPMRPKTTNRAPEVADAVRGLAANSPRAAQDLVRMHMEAVLNQALTPLQSGANQAAGARFSRAITGNPEQAATLEAAMKALPGGDQTWAGARRLLDIFDAQGQRQAVGSGTSFNNAIMTDLGKGKPIAEAGAAVVTGGLKLPQRIMDKIEGWRLGRGLDDMARLFTDPKMASTFRRLATEPPGSAGAVRLATVVVERGMRGYASTDRPNKPTSTKREPLKFLPAPR